LKPRVCGRFPAPPDQRKSLLARVREPAQTSLWRRKKARAASVGAVAHKKAIC
jgi:hypothetical protein